MRSERGAGSRPVRIVLAACGLALGALGLGAAPEPVIATHGMVASAQRLASEAGISILRQGGNAVDAAVATAYVLAVVYPQAGNLGGGGFMTYRTAGGQTRFLDFREKAPGRATHDMYLDAHGVPVPGRSITGWLAVGVPGSVAGLETARGLWGRLGRKQDLAPAVRLARDGFVLTEGDLHAFDEARDRPGIDHELRALLSRPDGTAWQPGDRLRQPNLARTLDAISRDGPDAFYHGAIGREIVRASEAGGGILAPGDLAAYRTRTLEPVACHYRGYLVQSAPPPSAGGVVICEVLNVLDGIDMTSLGFHSAAGVHEMAEAMRHAFVDRNTKLGDPDFVHAPIAELIGTAHADAIRHAIEPDRATPSSTLAGPSPSTEGHQTTQLSVVDQDGNAVSLTTTLNAWFGAGVIAGRTGIVMNDEMDDFATAPGRPNMFGLVQGEANAIAPGKTPLSSMSPTIVSKDGHLAMVIGSPGGSRIPTITLEAIRNVIDYGMDVSAAIDAPRLHEQWMPDVIEAERFALSPDTAKLLASMGYTIREHAEWGAAEGIVVRPDHLLAGANDVRAPAGAAVGY